MKKVLLSLILAMCFMGSVAYAETSKTAVDEQSKDSLLKIIASLQAQIAQLKAELGRNGTKPVQSCHMFNTNMGVGARGEDVSHLHQVLGREGFAVSASGAGGLALFDETTAAAVVRFQQKYGFPATGYVGPITREKLNSLCGTQKPIPVAVGNLSLTVFPEAVNSGETANFNLNAPSMFKSYKLKLKCDSNIEGSASVKGGLECGEEVGFRLDSSKNALAIPIVFSNTSSESEAATLVVTIFEDMEFKKSLGQVAANVKVLAKGSFSVTSPLNGASYDSSGQLPVRWSSYSGDFDYYQLMLGNKLANSEVQIDDGYQISKYQNSFNTFVLWSFVNQIVANSGKSAEEIKDSYYVVVNAVKSDRVGGGIVGTARSGRFTIKSPTTNASSITMIYPQAGNILDNSGAKDSGIIGKIQWAYQGAGNAPIHIALFSKEDQLVKYIATNLKPNTTSFAWAYDSSLPSGTYSIQVYEDMKGGASASTGLFRIESSPSFVLVPTCQLMTNKTSYKLGDTITYSWTSKNATYATFLQDTSGKDHLWIPGDKLSAEGSQPVTANVVGNPSVTLLVGGITGTGSCTATVNITQ
jgi:hypothetical protein